MVEFSIGFMKETVFKVLILISDNFLLDLN